MISYCFPSNLGKLYSRKETTHKYLQPSNPQRNIVHFRAMSVVFMSITPTNQSKKQVCIKFDHICVHAGTQVMYKLLHTHIAAKLEELHFCAMKTFKKESERVRISNSHFHIMSTELPLKHTNHV